MTDIDLLQGIVSEFRTFLDPLRRVSRDPRGVVLLLADCQWSLDGLLESDLAPLREGLETALTAFVEANLACEKPTTDEALLALAPALQHALEAIEQLHQGFEDCGSIALDPAIGTALGKDLAEYLALRYLARRAPAALQFAEMFGVVSKEKPAILYNAAGPDRKIVRFPVARPALHYDRIADFRADALVQTLRRMGMAGGAGSDAATLLGPGSDPLKTALGRLRAVLGDEALRGVSVALDISGITITGADTGLVDGGPLAIPFPIDNPPALTVAADAVTFTWQPALLPAAGADVVLFDQHGFVVAIPGAGADGCPARGLTLLEHDGALTLKLQGGLRLGLPLEAVTGVNGDAVAAAVCATLTLTEGEDPALALDRLTIGPATFHLGGASALRLEDARIEIGAVTFTTAAFDASALTTSVSGTIVIGDDVARVSATAGYDAATRTGSVTCTGSLTFSDGVVLEALDPATPVFALDASLDQQTVTIGGRLRVPRGAAIELVTVTGTMTMLTPPGGRPRLTAFAARSEVQASWALPGGITLTQAAVALAFDGTRVTATIEGAFELATPGLTGGMRCVLAVTLNPADPGDIRLDGQIDHARLNLRDQAAILDGTLAVAVRTKPAAGEPPVSLTLTGASAGLIARVAAPAAADDFTLAIEGLNGTLTASATSVALSITAGELLLPHHFTDEPAAAAGARPRLDLAAADVPLAITLDLPSAVSFSGRVTLQDVGVRVPLTAGGEAFVAHLDAATLDFSSATLPHFSDVSGRVELPMPDAQMAVIEFDGIEWDLQGLPTGTLALGADLSLALGGDFTLTLRHEPPAGTTLAQATGLTVTRQPAGGGRAERTEFRIYASARLVFPEAVLANDTGAAQVWAEAAGSLTLATDLERPDLAFDALAAGGTFRLGGRPDGLLLKDAGITVTGIEHAFNRSLDETHSLVIQISGAVVFPNQGPTLELDEARLIFWSNDLQDRPKFRVKGFAFEPGARLVDALPIQITRGALAFKNPDLDLPQLLQVDASGTSNISIELGAAFELPMGDAGTMARVDSIKATLERGVPHVSIGGIGFLVEDLTVSSMTLGGGVYLGGLEGLFQLPPDPSAVFGAGKLSGSMNGMGVTALAAFKLSPPMPLGICLGVEAGASGIPLGQTGILFTGAMGGISFANSNKSPCDMTAYIDIDDATGRPRALPTSAAGQPMTIPPPDTQEVHEREQPNKPLEFPGCPCECPPPSMNVFCQPHPDQLQFPGRVILKFTSLTEAFIGSLPVPVTGAGGTLGAKPLREWVESLPLPAGPAAIELLGTEIGIKLTDAIRDQAFRLWPGGAAAVPPALMALLDTTRAEMSKRIVEALHQIGPRTLWKLVCDEAYKGLPCPDVTEQITATFSYTGISSFLSVTGGVSISSTGAAGVIGWLNLVGIKVGRLRGFLTVTSPIGEIDPSICGQILLNIGPLDLGEVNALINCEGFLSGVRNAVVTSAGELGRPLVQRVIAATSETLRANPLFTTNPEQLLAQMTATEATAYAGEIARLFQRELLPPNEAARVRNGLLSLVQTIYDQFKPQVVFCGRVGPRLFGMPLGSDLISVNAWANKTGMGASAAFSPIGLILGAINAATATIGALLSGFEEALLGFTCDFPDPVQLVLDGLGGQFQTPAQLEAFAEQGVETILRNSNVVIGYRLSPFGMKLVDCGARAVLPDLVNHPALQGRASAWVRPPDRLELLQDILAAGKLVDAYWNGRLADVSPEYGDRWLNTDYFPHGGVIGAARVVLPRAILDAPPVDQLRFIATDGEVMPRLQAAMEYVKDYLLTTGEVGTIGFYAPAPNPPGFTYDGRALTREELLRCFSDAAFAEDVLAHTAPVNPDTSREAFFLGLLHGRLLGVPIVDAKAEFVPAGHDGPGSEGHMSIEAETPPNSWPRRLGLTASLEFRIRQSPATPMDVSFGAFARAVGISPDPLVALPASAAQTALDRLPRTPAQLQALIAEVRASVLAASDALEAEVGGSTLPADYPNRAEQMAARRAERGANLAPHLAKLADWITEWTGRLNASATPGMSANARAEALAAALVAEVSRLLAANLPKVALEAGFRLVLPQELAGLVTVAPAATGRATASLVAYSPGYDPDAGGDARRDAKRTGGVVMSAELRCAARFSGAAIDLAMNGQFTLTPGATPATVPRLRGQVDVVAARFQLWSHAVTLQRVRAMLDSAPEAGLPALSIAGELSALRLGKFAIEPIGGSTGRGSLDVRRGANGFTGSLSVPPSRLTLPLIASTASVLVHGATRNDSFTVGSDGSFSCGLTLDSELSLQSPFDPDDPPLLRINPAGLSATFSRAPSAVARLRVSVPATTSIVVFPEQPYEQRVNGQALQIEATSGGSVSLQMSLAPIDFGPFRVSGLTPADSRDAAIGVRMSPYGFTIAGARLRVGGYADAVRLRKFVINGSGDVRVSATVRTLLMPPFFKFTAGSIHFRRKDGHAHLRLSSPTLHLFPRTLIASELPLPDALDIDSSGAFSVHVDRPRRGTLPPVVTGRDLFQVAGRLSFGYDPASGLFVRISHGTFTLLAVPGTPALQATSVELTASTVTADLNGPPFGVAGLLTVGASSWRATVNVTAASIAMEATAPTVRILDRFDLPAAALSMSVNRDGLSFQAGPLDIVPGMLSVKAGRWSLTGDGLTFAGGITVLGRDLPATSITFTIAANGLKATLPQPLPLLSIAGLCSVTIPTNSLLLRRTANSFELSMHVAAALFGVTLDAEAAIATDGKVRLEWNDLSCPLGPFKLETNGTSHVEFNALRPLTPDLAIGLAAGKITARLGQLRSRWPSAGVATPAIDVDASGNFSAGLPAFTLDGIDLAADADNLLTFSRQDGIIAVDIANSVTFFGGGMDLRLRADNTGAIAGSITGTASVDFGGLIRRIDFGSVTLTYGDDNGYSFTATPSVAGVTFWLGWRPMNQAKACKLEHDSQGRRRFVGCVSS